MSRPAILVVLIALATSATTTLAGWELGVGAQTAWSDNDYLGDPDGWSLYLSKSLSDKLDIRGTYTQLELQSRYIGTLPFPLRPPGPWSVRQFIASSAQFHLSEVSLSFAIIEGNKMRLEAGGGMGFGSGRLGLYGEQTGESTGGGTDHHALSLNVRVLVKELIHSPLALRLAYQYQKLSSIIGMTTDSFEPFTDVTLSSVKLSLLARF